MFKLAKKWWNYLTAKLTGSFNERADPKVQLEQAIAEAQAQHKRLKEQAINVIAGQKQAELRLNAKMGELEKLNANARQASSSAPGRCTRCRGPGRLVGRWAWRPRAPAPEVARSRRSWRFGAAARRGSST